jgi:photosystem II protein
MSTTSAFAGVKVQPRVNVRSQRAQTVIMANSSGPKRVSVHPTRAMRDFPRGTRAGSARDARGSSRAAASRRDSRSHASRIDRRALRGVLSPARGGASGG